MKLKIQKTISNAGTVYFFQNKGRIVSTVEVDYYLQGKKKEGCVCNVETRKSSRRRGLCTRLMKRLIEEHGDKPLFLTVGMNCELGIQTMKKFYRRFGFKPDFNFPNTLILNKQGTEGR